MKKFVILFAVVMNLVLADAVTKELAERLLASGDSFVVLPGFFDFALVHNRGCAWGMFQGHVWPLAVFGLLALVILLWQRRKIFPQPPASSTLQRFNSSTAPLHLRLFSTPIIYFPEPLLYAGILGNVIDRLFRGYVVDMFDFHWKNVYHYPCFNLADVYICTAAGLLILASFLEKKPR